MCVFAALGTGAGAAAPAASATPARYTYEVCDSALPGGGARREPTGCYACQEIGYRRSYELFDLAIEQLRAKASPAATLGPACALIGGQVALDLMHHLTGLAEPSTLGAAHVYDLRTMELKREAVASEPSCPVCGETAPDRKVNL